MRTRTPRSQASKLLYPDGTVQHAGVVICLDRVPRHVYRGFPGDHPAVDRSRAFQAVTGACLLVRRAEFEALGGFDERFHNGYEDIDLCLRLRAAGRSVRYCHTSVLYHLESVSRGSRFDEHNQALWDASWRRTVHCDEFEHYVEDGLLEVVYAPYYPLALRVAPEVALVDPGENAIELERLLVERARQVWGALRDNVALTVELNEHRHGAVPALPASPRLQQRRAAAEPEPVAAGRVHVLGEGGPLVSVCLPVKNGGARLEALLDAILAQEADCRLELVAVDSGSTDGSVDALVARGARVVRIRPEDFNHGRTRNLLATLADGDPLVYLSQRATPDGTGWLAPLLHALQADPKVAGASSRMLPPGGFSLLAQRDVLRDLNGSPTSSTRALTPGELATLGAHDLRVRINFHTVSAALRREALERVPFREMRTIGEDVQWARDVMELGWAIRHEAASVVRHGDDAPLFTVLGRNVDDGVANHDVVGRTWPRRVDVLPAIEAMVRDDWAFLAELGLEGEELDRERIASVLRRAAQVAGQYVGANADQLGDGLVAGLSEVTRRVGGASELP